MPKIAIVFGILLALVGAGFYFGTGTPSVTALIPAFVGVPLAALGFAARGAREGVRKHLMHAAAMVGLLGFLASAGRLVTKGFGAATAAVAEQIVMALLCLAFVALCVNSFVQARRSRAAE
jgi:hypothetical protein